MSVNPNRVENADSDSRVHIDHTKTKDRANGGVNGSSSILQGVDTYV
jgi:hypothetical protein